MPNYEVKSNLHFDGKAYKPGESVTMSKEQARLASEAVIVKPGKGDENDDAPKG